MASSRVLKNHITALKLHLRTNGAIVFASICALSKQSACLFSQTSSLVQCILTLVHVIIFFAIWIMITVLILWYPSSLERISAMKLTLLSYGTLSICWFAIGFIQSSLNRLFPSATDDPLPTRGYSGKDLNEIGNDNDKPTQSGDIAFLYVFWLLILSLVACTLGLIGYISNVVMEKNRQEYETARASELRSESAESLPLWLPQHQGTSQRVSRSEKTVYSRHNTQESVEPLAKKKDGQPTIDDDKALTWSRWNIFLGVNCLLISLAKLLVDSKDINPWWNHEPGYIPYRRAT